jgi:hypothetical protein
MRGARRASRHGRLAALGALSMLVAIALGACGAQSFKNDPRPAAQIEVSAKVDSHHVLLSPNTFGAGIVNFTVANLSGAPISFKVSGPTEGTTTEIQPGAPDYLKMDLKEGTYQATVGKSKIRPATIKVGPKRSSSQNKLLLP